MSGLAVLTAYTANPHGASAAEIAGYRFGQAFMMVAVPFLIAYAIAGARKRRNGTSFAAIFCFLAAFFIFSNWRAEHNRPTSSNDYAQRLTREATGQQPVSSVGGEQGQMEAVMREMISQIPEINRRYYSSLDAADLSETKKLFEPETFRDEAEMRKVGTQLQALLDIEEGQERNLRELVENTKRKAQMANWSERGKRDFISGLDKGAGKSMAPRERLLAAEREWITSAQAVYRYALARKDEVVVKDGHLIIAADGTRTEFNLREQNAREKEKLFDQEKQAFEAFQSKTVKEIGFSPEDVKRLGRDR